MTDSPATPAAKTDAAAEPVRPLSRHAWRSVLGAMLFGLSLLLFLPGWFTLPPVDRDEARFAVASRQMVESGDYVDIRFQEGNRYKKPAGIYWLQAGSVYLLGAEQHTDVIWAYRVPSLVGALAAVLLTFSIGCLVCGTRAGFMAGLLLAICLLVTVEARLAKTDAALLTTILLAQGALAWLYLRPDGARVGLGVPLLFWSAQALGFLIKGPIITLVSFGTIAALCLLERRADWLHRLRWLPGLALFALLVLPWYLAIGVISEGDFYQASLGRDLLGKVFEGQESHGAPPGTYLLALWLTFWPAVLYLGLAAPVIWRERRTPLVRFLIAWLVPTFLLFELVATKLPHYVLPTYPALTLLTAWAFDRHAAEIPTRGWRFWLPVLVTTLVTLALSVAVTLLPTALEDKLYGFAALSCLLALIAWYYVVRLARRRQFAASLLCALSVALLLNLAAFRDTFPRLASLNTSQRVAEAVDAGTSCAPLAVASAGYHEPSVIFTVGAEIELIGTQALAEFLQQGPCRRGVVRARDIAVLRDALGQDAARLTEVTQIEGVALSKSRWVDLRVVELAPATPGDAAP